MSAGPRIAAAGMTVVLMTGALALTGCTTTNAPTVTQVDPASIEGTATLTPLEKGQVRREVLESMQAGIDAWIAGDPEGMRVYFGDAVMSPFEKAWEEPSAKGLVVVHEHEPLYFDMIDLNKPATQALVTYRYNDTSYLANENGTKVEDLESLEENEIQFTVEKQDDGTWKAVRIIGASLR